MGNKTKLLVLFFLFFSVFLFIFQLNRMTPMHTDDFIYLYKYKTFERVASISDIIESQYTHYMQWGGRSVAHIIAQSLLLLPSFWIDVLNSIAYVLFTIVIYLHVKGQNKFYNISAYIYINLLMWFLQPAFGESILWITGSSNYLWCGTIILFFLLPYRIYNSTINKKSNLIAAILKSVVMLLFGIVAGWTNENIALAMMVMLFLWLVVHWYQKRTIPAWAIFGLIGAVIGYLFMVFAPGNYVRLEGLKNINSYSLFAYYYRFNMYTMRFFDYLGGLNAVLLILLVLVFYFGKISKRVFTSIFIIYAVGLFVSVYTMLFSLTFPTRAWFGCITLNIILFGLVAYNLDYERKFVRYINMSLLLLGLIAFPFNFYNAYKDINRVNIEWENRTLEIAATSPNDSIIFKGLVPETKFSMGDGNFYKEALSKYYNRNISFDLN